MRGFLLLFVILCFCACNSSKQVVQTAGALKSSYNFGYQPLDPLDAKVFFDNLECDTSQYKFKNIALLNSLPDETMRMAIKGRNSDIDISALGNSVSAKNESYTVIIDYIKTDTKSFSFSVEKIDKRISLKYDNDFQSGAELMTFPIYVGVGIRLKADLHTSEAGIDLTNLFSIGAAASAGKLRGNLSVQTLGITGPSISPNIPIPTEISNGSISNAILAIGAIKAKIYEKSTVITPRIVGFYNTAERVDIMNALIIAFLGNDFKLRDYVNTNINIVTTL